MTDTLKKYVLHAEHMSVDKARRAAKAAGVRVNVRMDSLFSQFAHITTRACTKEDAGKLQNEVWELNGGAFCEMEEAK